MWQDFLSYQVAAGLPTCQVDTHLLLSFMEFLWQNGHSKANIANYVAALRTLYIIHGLPTQPFTDQRIQLYLKALKLNAPFQPTIRPTLDIAKLHSLLGFCESVPHSNVFKALYLTCFFSFLRLSNSLPHSLSTFDVTRHIARADFITAGSGAVLLLKWSKQYRTGNPLTIPLPNLAHSSLCPIRAISLMIQQVLAGSNDPLFTIQTTRGPIPHTDSVARKHLKNASTALHISPSLTFHAFRRAGASWAFSHGVPLEHIMRHGTWKSDAIWTYLSSSTSTVSPVSAAFQAAIHQQFYWGLGVSLFYKKFHHNIKFQQLHLLNIFPGKS